MRSPETRCTGPLLIYVTDSELPEEPQAGQPPGPPLRKNPEINGGRREGSCPAAWWDEPEAPTPCVVHTRASQTAQGRAALAQKAVATFRVLRLAALTSSAGGAFPVSAKRGTRRLLCIPPPAPAPATFQPRHQTIYNVNMLPTHSSSIAMCCFV